MVPSFETVGTVLERIVLLLHLLLYLFVDVGEKSTEIVTAMGQHDSFIESFGGCQLVDQGEGVSFLFLGRVVAFFIRGELCS